MGRVEGKVVFITGVARGQGRAHAQLLAQEGAHIIGIDICEDIPSTSYGMATKADMEETQSLIEAAGGKAVLRVADVRDAAGVTSALDEGVRALGALDGVIAQAGICPLGSTDPAAFVDTVNVAIGGVLNSVTAALPHLKDGASIVATGSLAGLLNGAVDNPILGTGGMGYALGKRMIAQYVHDLAVVLAPRKIRVNAIHPSNANTPMLHQEAMYRVFRPDLEHPTREDAELTFPMMNAMPVGYIEPEDAAKAALFLISDDSRYISGMQLRVDAGAYVKGKPQTSPF